MMESLLPRNESNLDRGIRVVLGVVLLALAFVGPQTPFGFIGIVPLATGLLGSCPIYRMLGISSCPVKQAKKPA